MPSYAPHIAPNSVLSAGLPVLSAIFFLTWGLLLSLALFIPFSGLLKRPGDSQCECRLAAATSATASITSAASPTAAPLAASLHGSSHVNLPHLPPDVRVLEDEDSLSQGFTRLVLSEEARSSPNAPEPAHPSPSHGRTYLINYVPLCCTTLQLQSCVSALRRGITECRMLGHDSLDRNFLHVHRKALEQTGTGANANASSRDLRLWMPYIVLRTLLSVADGDVVVYGSPRLNFTGNLSRLVGLVHGHDVVPFLGDFESERVHTKRATFRGMGCSPEEEAAFAAARRRSSDIVVLRRSLTSVRFASQWLDYSSDWFILSGDRGSEDSVDAGRSSRASTGPDRSSSSSSSRSSEEPSPCYHKDDAKLSEYDDYKAHWGAASVFSVLTKKWGLPVQPDPGPEGETDRLVLGSTWGQMYEFMEPGVSGRSKLNQTDTGEHNRLQ